MHEVKLTFSYRIAKFNFCLYETFLQEFTQLDMFYHDFRNHLVLFKVNVHALTPH